MKQDNIVRTLLGLIVLLLGVIAFEPTVTSRTVAAAAPTEWACVDIVGNKPEFAQQCSEKLRAAQKDGWQFVGADTTLLMFKR